MLPLTPWKLSQECKATLLYCMAANYEQKFFFDKKIFKLKCEVFSDANIFLQNCFWVLKVAKIVGIHIHMKYENAQKSSYTSKPLHRGAFCQFSFRWIWYCDSNKFTGKGTGKTHLCVLVCFLVKSRMSRIGEMK